MAYNRKNYIRKAKLIHKLTYEYYEVGRQDRSLAAVWRRWVNPQYPMTYRTFLSYLAAAKAPPVDTEHPKLPLLFED